MSWVPDVHDQKEWFPAVEPPVFQALNGNYVIPYIAQASDKGPYARYDLRPNVTGGREPYTFTIDPLHSTMPGATLIEPRGVLLLPYGGPVDSDYDITIDVRDANNQQISFHFRTQDVPGPLAFESTPSILPAAHTGDDEVYLYSFPKLQGGVPPYTVVFVGLDLDALGFTFDGTGNPAILQGHYNGSVGDSGHNLVLIQAYNSTSDPNSDPPDAELVMDWGLRDP